MVRICDDKGPVGGVIGKSSGREPVALPLWGQEASPQQRESGTFKGKGFVFSSIREIIPMQNQASEYRQ